MFADRNVNFVPEMGILPLVPFLFVRISQFVQALPHYFLSSNFGVGEGSHVDLHEVSIVRYVVFPCFQKVVQPSDSLLFFMSNDYAHFGETLRQEHLMAILSLCDL